MLKRTLTIFALLVFISGIGYSQLKTQKATKIDPQSLNEVNSSGSSSTHLQKATGSQLLFTDYDYAGNNSIPNMVDMYDFTGDGIKDLVATAMQRFDVGTRQVKMIVGNTVDGFTDFLAAHASAGWGTVQVGRTGPWNNKAAVAYHAGGNSWISLTDMTTLTPTFAAAFSIAGNFPYFVYKDNGDIYMTNNNGELFKSTDQTTFTSTNYFLDPDIQVPGSYYVTGYNSEYLLKKSPNGQYMAHVSCWGGLADGGNGGPGGVPVDSTDFVGMNYSTDGGATWTFELMGRDGLTPVDNRPGYLPIFENFGQINFVVDNNGVVHVGMNGYGFRITATDTSFGFPALYWNSRDKKWLAISSEAVEIDYDTANAGVGYIRPGNGLGNAYVVPSISEDGSKIVMLWQGPEYSGTPGASPANIWTPTATSTAAVHYTDFYYAVSGDGGVTWSAPALIPDASNQMVQESYPSPNNYLDVKTDSMFVDYVYMIDAIPGTSFSTFTNPNEPSNNTSWNYGRFGVAIPAAVTVDITFAVDMGVQAFKGLFNPATDSVHISGSFNGWNTSADPLTDVDGDTIYTITKTFNAGEALTFKFHKGVGDAGYETIDNRTYTVPSANATYSAYFNNDNSYQILTPVQVTFACNMEFEIVSGRFNPAADTLSARGSFNGWSSAWAMAPSVGDPNVYEVTKTVNTFEGEAHNYKYAYIHGPSTSWENDPNKVYTVSASDLSTGFAYVLRTYNDATLETVTNQPCTIKFTVDMSNAISAINLQPLAPVTDVRLCGANAPLMWPAGGWPNADSAFVLKCYDDGTHGDVTAGDQIWSLDLTFPQYSPLHIQYKYGANWGLPTNQGGNDNENGVGADHFITLTPTLTTGTVANIFGIMGEHTLVGILKELSGLPTSYDLAQNFPNPFNPSTSIRFSIPEAGLVTLKIFNLLGEEVTTLINEYKNVGNYEVKFDASRLTSGLYIYSINSGNYKASKKMMLMK